MGNGLSGTVRTKLSLISKHFPLLFFLKNLCDLLDERISHSYPE
jgi:hypothetical protein